MSTPADELPSPEANELLERALRLPRHEQECLAAKLRFAMPVDEEGWPDDLSPEWKAEIERRVKSVLDGTAVLHDGEEVFARLRAKYGV